MANTIGTAYVQIEPTTQGISGSLSNILDSEASAAGASAGGKLSSALGTAAKVGVAAIAGATTAIGAFGKASIDAGMQFDSSMSQVAATMGFSTEELNKSGSEAAQTFEKLRNFAQEMGSTTAFSASEAADALNYMALAGYDADTSMQMLPNVLNLAAAGGIDLASASDMVTDAQSALGLSLEETGVMVDQMAAASSKSNTSVAQLGEAFLTIGANAKSLSGGTQELSTALGILADNGIKGAEGGTHLRNIMLSLNPTTKTAAGAWDQLGVSAYDAQGNLRPLEDTFADLNKAMEGMTDQEKSDIITKMFNKTDLASVNALLATSSERWTELSGAIGDASGAAQNMADVQLDNLNGDITLFQSALEGAKIAVSDQLTPSLREFVQFGAEGLSELTESFKEGGLNGAMEKAGELLGELVNKVIEMLPDMIDAGLKLLGALVQGIMDNLPTLIDASIKIVTMIGQYIIENLPMLIDAGIQIITQLAFALAEALPDLVPTIVDVVLEIADTLVDNIDLVVDAAIAIMVGLTEGIIKALPKLIEKAPEIIIKFADAIVKNVPKLLQAAGEMIISLIKGLNDNLPSLLDAGANLIVKLIEKFMTLKDKIKEVGKNIIDGLKQGINDAWETLKSWLTDKFSGLVSSVCDALRIGSPSKVFRDEVGRWIPEGVAVGIEANMDSVTGAMDDMALETLNAGNKVTKTAYSVSADYARQTSSDNDTENAIFTLLQTYLPNVATNDRLNNLNFNVNNREFARLVNGVV